MVCLLSVLSLISLCCCWSVCVTVALHVVVKLSAWLLTVKYHVVDLSALLLVC